MALSDQKEMKEISFTISELHIEFCKWYKHKIDDTKNPISYGRF